MLYIAMQPLPWDSKFLGYSVARLTTTALMPEEIDTALVYARQAGIKLLYVVADPEAKYINTILQQYGAWLADRKTTFVMPLHDAAVTAWAPSIQSTTVYTPQLESLAWQSGEYSRFRLDPHFDDDIFRRLYSQWLHNSLDGSIAQQVLVWRSTEGQQLGLMTLGEKDQSADIGLLAVDSTARGQRIGHKLVAAAQSWAVSEGYDSLYVVTQRDNLSACSFYIKCGFTPVHIENIYHLWFF
jgi:dTDP-4-amino-4,6-dideoxy-D-galactose acyltransferase